jgi:predicted O-linked N-acetylglucosamine transferase (SPINDLY family)
LPDTFMAADSKRKIAERVPARAEYQLPDSAFVFCAFNNSYKISPSVFDVWMRLLSRVEGSVLWLSDMNETAKANLCREAQSRGIEPARLIFAPRAPLNEDHLARHRLADLFLDTTPYNAHATTNDALWAGLPVLTCAGASFAGRVASSLLKAVGLPELVTKTTTDYERIAFELATSPDKLASLRQKLSANRLTAPLFDTVRFTRNIEATYAAMAERRRAGLPPDHISL